MIDQPLFTEVAAWEAIERAWASNPRPTSPSRANSEVIEADMYHSVHGLRDEDGFIGVGIAKWNDVEDRLEAEIVFEDPYDKW